MKLTEEICPRLPPVFIFSRSHFGVTKVTSWESKQKCTWPAQCLASLIIHIRGISTECPVPRVKGVTLVKGFFLEEIAVTQHFKPSKPFCLSFLFSSVDDNQFMMDMWWMPPARVEMDGLSLFYQPVIWRMITQL